MSTQPIDYKNIYYPPGGILIWMLIVLELLTFGVSLIALAFFSLEDPLAYHNSRLLLNPTFGAINTIFLLTSGYFMAISLKYFKNDDRKKSSFFMKLTMLGGLLFLVLKGIEYSQKIDHGFTLGYDSFFNFYWLLTGFHVIHVLVGLIILLSIHYGLRNEKKETKLEDVEAGAAFWHMCDLIWLVLFPILYLIL